VTLHWGEGINEKEELEDIPTGGLEEREGGGRSSCSG